MAKFVTNIREFQGCRGMTFFMLTETDTWCIEISAKIKNCKFT